MTRQMFWTLIKRHAPNEGHASTCVAGVGLIRSNHPTVLRGGILRPSVCVVMAGKKAIQLGKDSIAYGAGNYLASTIDMPAAGQVTAATSARPYLSVIFDLPASEIAAVLMEAKLRLALPATQAESNAAFDRALRHQDPEMGIRDLEMLDAFGAGHGLHRTRVHAMPANNHLAVWHKDGRSDE